MDEQVATDVTMSMGPPDLQRRWPNRSARHGERRDEQRMVLVGWGFLKKEQGTKKREVAARAMGRGN